MKFKRKIANLIQPKKNFIIKSLPGSRYITLGGMIANNTQGKNIKNWPVSGWLILTPRRKAAWAPC